MLAQVAAAVMNFSTGRPNKPVEVADLMPSQRNRSTGVKAPTKRRRYKSRAKIAQEIHEVMSHFMGAQNGHPG